MSGNWGAPDWWRIPPMISPIPQATVTNVNISATNSQDNGSVGETRDHTDAGISVESSSSSRSPAGKISGV